MQPDSTPSFRGMFIGLLLAACAGAGAQTVASTLAIAPEPIASAGKLAAEQPAAEPIEDDEDKAVDTAAAAGGANPATGKQAASKPTTKSTTKPPVKAAAPAKSFVERRPLVSTEAYRELAEQMARGSVLSEVAERLNAKIQLPTPVSLRFAECGEVNAYFLPEQGEVRLCFELFDRSAELLAEQVADEAQLADALRGVLSFVALHEAGHAVVALRAVPVIGNEETAVDQFAVWLLVDGDQGDLAILSAAAAFAAGMTLGGDDPAGAHVSDEQRYYNLLCWLGGSSPARQQQVMADWGLPESRATSCSDEFRQLSQSWSQLLAPPASTGGNAKSTDMTTPDVESSAASPKAEQQPTTRHPGNAS